MMHLYFTFPYFTILICVFIVGYLTLNIPLQKTQDVRFQTISQYKPYSISPYNQFSISNDISRYVILDFQWYFEINDFFIWTIYDFQLFFDTNDLRYEQFKIYIVWFLVCQWSMFDIEIHNSYSPSCKW